MTTCVGFFRDEKKPFGGRLRSVLSNLVIPAAVACSVSGTASAFTISALPATYEGSLTLFTAQIFGAPAPSKTLSAPGTLFDFVPSDPSDPSRVREAKIVVAAVPQPSIRGNLLVHDWPFVSPDGTSVSASITYYVVVNGPSSGVIVPIDMKLGWNISARKDTAQTDPKSAEFSHSIATVGFATEPFITGDDPSSNVSVTVDTDKPGPQTTCSGPDIGLCSLGPNVSGFIHFNVKSRTDVMVAMNLFLANSFGGRAEGFIDPIISIDPDFLKNNPGYSLSLSDGIGNTPPGAVPIPAALWLFGSALGGIGFIRRRIA